MSLMVITCACGSAEGTARNFLHSVNYQDWMSLPINKGKEKSFAMLNYLPPTPEKEMLKSFLSSSSKWVVVIGYNDSEVKWSDISHNAPKSTIEAEMVVRAFA